MCDNGAQKIRGCLRPPGDRACMVGCAYGIPIARVDSPQGGAMPKYLIQASYTAEGTKGILRHGGSKRRASVEEMVKRLGGTLEAFYFAFGDADVYLICDIPDVASAAAISLAVNASGAVELKTIPLISVEEIDLAAKKQVGYSAPGTA